MDQYPASAEDRQEKADANRAMFDRIASRYDLLNRVMSLGLDAWWRRRLVALCALQPHDLCLDLCCGTGDVTRLLARHGARAVGLDASANMLAVARRHDPRLSYVQGDALALPFADAQFSAVTIAFGNRNVASLERLYAEMRRVAQPGGRVVSLEINCPTVPWLAALFFLYFSHVPPLAARIFGVDAAAYHYLPASVRRYPGPEAVAAIMANAGLHDIHIERYLGGALVLHRAFA
ncbi:MAG TPA: ubiquinone/menaquinone biosynthesis methyltransferase [Armatimonadota bacterium]|jgi:demethylmenaquinone methyltransferase/2-methoxy-6-polyprenyl-1,4-benzoquinol methylase